MAWRDSVARNSGWRGSVLRLLGWPRSRTENGTASGAATGGEQQEAPAYGGWLLLWMVLLFACNGLLWLAGPRGKVLGVAVETGTARVESLTSGEASTDVIRKAIQLQRDTMPFWATLQLVGDLVIAPAMLGIRAVAVAAIFSAWAAMRGRPTRFGRAMAESVRWQGVWVLSAVTQLVLTLMLGGREIDTSLAVMLPPGEYPASVWMSLKQMDLFAMVGWCALAMGAWRRKQAGLIMAVLITSFLFLLENSVASSFNLILGAAMRVSLMPG